MVMLISSIGVINDVKVAAEMEKLSNGRSLHISCCLNEQSEGSGIPCGSVDGETKFHMPCQIA